ncbi:histidine kinase [Mucilaginibacter gossypii]|uniref:sensor histidine kinase n=1 Tax=Mucilaginibacter gossypii TaxID=551996 RepID=UPI000DCF3469|nr:MULTISPECIES: histidine kinase [Mucilaginibacter]QTE39748.1 histidine kinase [Mucilaginibacter gossypii]RAV58358.1 hypothetical protein DIU36_10310 [Mucilaginibacter rubeus]
MIFKNFNPVLIFKHTLAWLLFVIYEVSFIVITTGKVNGGFLSFFSYYIVNVSFFYFNASVVLPSKKNLGNARMIFLAAGIMLELSIYVIIMLSLGKVLDCVKTGASIFTPFVINKIILVKYIWRGLYFLGFSTAYYSMLSAIEQRKKINELERRNLINQKEKVELERNLTLADNAYLRSQINPHLLFNSLNFIYNSIHEISPKASETVILLADIMRYSLSEMDEDGKVEMEKEISHISNLLKINQIRFNNKLQLELVLDGDFKNLKILPLSLLTLVENVYKHGDLTDSRVPGKIIISYDRGVFHMITQNKTRKYSLDKGNGIGLINLKTRLNNFHNNKFSFEAADDGELFITDLKIFYQ